MNNLKLFVVLLGGKPQGRMVEQHDVFAGVAEELKDLMSEMISYWPGVDIHIDGYTAMNFIDEYMFEFLPKTGEAPNSDEPKLYFIKSSAGIIARLLRSIIRNC